MREEKDWNKQYCLFDTHEVRMHLKKQKGFYAKFCVGKKSC